MNLKKVVCSLGVIIIIGGALLINAMNAKDVKVRNIFKNKFDIEQAMASTQSAYDNGIAKVFVYTVDNKYGVDLYTDTSKEKVDVAIIIKNEEKENNIEYKGYGTINVRGNTTSKAAKKPYNIKFEEKEDIFGMGKAKKWSLLASTFDKSLIRNKIGLDFMRKLEENHKNGMQYTSNCKYVDLYIDGKYLGNYLFTESVEVGESRVDIDLSQDVLLEIANDCKVQVDRYDEESYYFKTKELDLLFAINEPERSEDSEYSFDPASKNKPEFVKNTKEFLDKFEKEIIKKNGNIEKYIDVESFVDYYLTAELFMIKDIKFSSTRFYIKDGKLYAGPLWDLDLSSGNMSDNKSYKGFYAQKLLWFKHLMKNDAFKKRVKERYKEIKPLIKNIYKEDGDIDKAYEEIKESAKCNYEKAYNKFTSKEGWGYDVIYGVLGFYEAEEAKVLGAEDFVFGSNDAHDNYEDYVKEFKKWMKNRDKWLKENL